MLQSKAGYIDARPLTASSAKPLATHGRTIHLGQNRASRPRNATSGLPRGTDIVGPIRLVRFVPTHKVAALQPAARGQEPRERKPADRKALAGLRAPS